MGHAWSIHRFHLNRWTFNSFGNDAMENGGWAWIYFFCSFRVHSLSFGCSYRVPIFVIPFCFGFWYATFYIDNWHQGILGNMLWCIKGQWGGEVSLRSFFDFLLFRWLHEVTSRVNVNANVNILISNRMRMCLNGKFSFFSLYLTILHSNLFVSLSFSVHFTNAADLNIVCFCSDIFFPPLCHSSSVYLKEHRLFANRRPFGALSLFRISFLAFNLRPAAHPDFHNLIYSYNQSQWIFKSFESNMFAHFAQTFSHPCFSVLFMVCLAVVVVVVPFSVFKLELMAIAQLYSKFNFQRIGNLPTIESIFTMPFIHATEYNNFRKPFRTKANTHRIKSLFFFWHALLHSWKLWGHHLNK